MIASVDHHGRKLARSVTWNCAPAHSCPANLWNVGWKYASRKCTPGRPSRFSLAHRSRASIHGAPNSSKGLVVPRASETLVASNKHIPGYTTAVSTVGMFGDGRTHGNPVSSK